MTGKTVLVNAGPTHEKIDPVRFIGNYSSGKMGISIAREASRRGANVILVIGPVDERIDYPGITVIEVISAEEMARETMKHFNESDIAVLTAAVADYTPVSSSDSKIKKEDRDMVIKLKPTMDIAAELGKKKKPGQVIAGFALETDNEKSNAISKLRKKNLDLIVLNSLREKGAGFRYDTNRVSIIDKNNNIEDYELKPKAEVAVDILNKIETMI